MRAAGISTSESPADWAVCLALSATNVAMTVGVDHMFMLSGWVSTWYLKLVSFFCFVL